MIPEEALKEFKQLYKKRFKKELSDEEVYKKAVNLLDFYRAVYGSYNFSGQRKDLNKYKIK